MMSGRWPRSTTYLSSSPAKAHLWRLYASKSSAPRPARSRAVQLLVLCGLLLASAILAGTSFIVASLHNRVLADNERELRNLALVLAEQTDRTFQALEVVQASLIERSQALGVASSDDYRREMSSYDVHVMLKDKIQSMPHVDVVALLTLKGSSANFRVTGQSRRATGPTETN